MKTKIILSTMIALAISFAVVAQKQPGKKGKSASTQTTGITKAKLFGTTNVEDLLPEFPKTKFKVISYKLSVIQKGKDPAEFESTNNQVSRPMKETIKTAAPGSKIYIEYVKGQLKDNTDTIVKTFRPAAYVLTE